MKKYELVLDDKRIYIGRTLYRIRALKDFTCIDGIEVHKGDLGGYVQGEHNLSQEGLSWVRDYGEAFNGGKVLENALVFEHGKVYGNGIARNNAIVGDGGEVRDNATVGKDAYIFKVYHVLTVDRIDNKDGITTFYRDKDNEISVICNYFNGKIDDFSKWVVKEYGDSKYGQAYQKAIELAKIQIDLS